MESQNNSQLITIIGYVLFASALLSIILMSLTDYTAEQIKLNEVRKEYRATYCDTITADISKCAKWQAEQEK